MRLLVADGSEDSRETLSAALERRGHRVLGVSTADEALAALEGAEFDVLFADVALGRSRGLELLTRALERWPRLLVVILTRKAVTPAIRALQRGAFDYLRSPVRAAQLDRVLRLVEQQLALARTGAKPLDPARYASALAAVSGYEVLLVAPPPIRLRGEKVIHLSLDPDNPVEIRAAVEEFVVSRDRAAVVLAGVEELLARHREEEIAQLLEGLRSLLEGKGPLAVGYDPDRITATGALAVRASIVSADAHSTLEALSSPVRRLVLRRLKEGPSTFTQAMEAARLDDRSVIAFHLRKLTETGLVSHGPGERYRLTPRGEGAIRILRSVDELDSAEGSGNRVFPSVPRVRAGA